MGSEGEVEEGPREGGKGRESDEGGGREED